MPETPPSGISSLDPHGNRAAIETTAARRKRRNRGEVLTNPEMGRRVDPNTPPPGAQRRRVDIIEMPIEHTRSDRYTATYMSADGESYRFRTHDAKGNPDPRRENLAVFLALREMSLGGDPMAILNAFRLRIDDMDGKQVFPLINRSASGEAEPTFTLGE